MKIDPKVVDSEKKKKTERRDSQEGETRLKRLHHDTSTKIPRRESFRNPDLSMESVPTWAHVCKSVSNDRAALVGLCWTLTASVKSSPEVLQHQATGKRKIEKKKKTIRM